MDGAPTCSRIGCDQPAVVVFAFDALECLVWLDPLGSDGRGAGVLCGLHADRMTPPRGWNLLDRRGVESRLWIGRTNAVAPPAAASRRRERAPRTRPCAPTGPRLPFETAVARDPEASVVRAPQPDGQPWSPHDRPGPELERVLDARTPLLARAFERSRPVDDAD